MPRCEGTKAPLLKEGEQFIRVLVSAPTSGARYGNFYFCEKNEPIDVTQHELDGLRTDERLAILVPGDLGNENAEKDNRIALLLSENQSLRGKIVELEGQVKDRDAALKHAQSELEEATAPAAVRGTVSTTEHSPADKEPSRASRKTANPAQASL